MNGLNWTAHPLFPVPTPEEMRLILSRPGGAERLADIYATRENAILAAKSDPFNCEPEPPHWADADRLLADQDAAGRVLFLILLGGNRSGKSRYAGRRLIESAVRNPGSKFLCLAENFESSIETQQQILWHYLPNEFKALNGKQSKKFYIKYSSHHGFSDQLLALPGGTKFMFKTYQQDPADMEGQMFGLSGRTIPAVWADENLRVNWWLMLQRRLRFQQAQLIWSFTPINGMTATIKEAVGDAPQTLESRYAELLTGRVNVPGLPESHMPYVQRAATTRARVIYFFSEFNRFGDGQRTFYDAVKDDCRGKDGKPRSAEYIQRIAYGYTRDTMGRPFPKFGEWNVIKPERIPAGTDYQFTDPAGARNWATLWVRVAADGRFYIVADWPDAATYGEWAVPNLEGSGDSPGKLYKAGPAQNSLGLGTTQLRQTWRAIEAELGLDVAARFIDPRAGRNPHAEVHGGTCLIDQLAEPGGEDDPGMEFLPASGTDVRTRIGEVNKLLFWHEEAKLDMVANAPSLFVSERAEQVIACFNHWPGPDAGEKEPNKDFADLLGYMAMQNLEWMDEKRERCYV